MLVNLSIIYLASFKKKRREVISEIKDLYINISQLLTPSQVSICKAAASLLKEQVNLFILGRGPGYFIAKYMAEKFMLVGAMNAEAYPSGEFRHGPLSLIDDTEKTPVIFIALDDEHLNQIQSNILQVKDRGATVIVVTNCPQKVARDRIDSLIEVPPSGLFGALLALVPLQLVCYYSSVEKGLNPDQETFDAIDFMHKISSD